jgi:hypothetical protein
MSEPPFEIARKLELCFEVFRATGGLEQRLHISVLLDQGRSNLSESRLLANLDERVH